MINDEQLDQMQERMSRMSSSSEDGFIKVYGDEGSFSSFLFPLPILDVQPSVGFKRPFQLTSELQGQSPQALELDDTITADDIEFVTPDEQGVPHFSSKAAAPPESPQPTLDPREAEQVLQLLQEYDVSVDVSSSPKIPLLEGSRQVESPTAESGIWSPTSADSFVTASPARTVASTPSDNLGKMQWKSEIFS